MPDTLLIDPGGRSITLHDATWVVHVVRRHPDMRNHRALAEQAVRTPVAIHLSRSDPDCRLYYGPGPRPATMTAVVANVVDGYVKTAYLTSRTTGVPE